MLAHRMWTPAVEGTALLLLSLRNLPSVKLEERIPNPYSNRVKIDGESVRCRGEKVVRPIGIFAE